MKMNITDFKAKCLRVLDEVEKTGIPVQITRHNRVIARVVFDSESPLKKPWKALIGSGEFCGDPFAPVLDEDELNVLK